MWLIRNAGWGGMGLDRAVMKVGPGSAPVARRTLWTSAVASLLSMPSGAVRGPEPAFIEHLPRAAGEDPHPTLHALLLSGISGNRCLYGALLHSVKWA